MEKFAWYTNAKFMNTEFGMSIFENFHSFLASLDLISNKTFKSVYMYNDILKYKNSNKSLLTDQSTA